MKLLSPRLFSLAVIVTVVLTCTGAIQAQAKAKQDQIYSKKEISLAMERVFAWQVANPVETNLRNNNQWARAAFYAGIMSA